MKKDTCAYKLFWVLTDNCNLRCRYCYYNTNLEHKSFSGWNLSEAIKYSKSLAMTFNEVVLTGGEPLIIKNIDLLVKELSIHGSSVTLLTNGILLDDTLQKKLVEAGLKKIIISLDSLDLKINNYLRGNTVTILKTLEHLIKTYKDKVKIQLSVTVCNKNIDSLGNLISFCKRKKIELWINPLQTKLPELNLTPTSLKSLNTHLSNWSKLFFKGNKSHYIELINELIKKKLVKTKCSMGINRFILDVDRNFYRCFLDKKKVFANISDKNFANYLKNSCYKDNEVTCAKLGCVCLTEI